MRGNYIDFISSYCDRWCERCRFTTRCEDVDGDPIQNDWNGSAKVALISIVRSIKAWEVVACATCDPDAHHIKEQLTQLQHDVERSFPDALR